MVDLGPKAQTHFGALATAAERLVVQRWLELTFDHTHPEWRLQGHPPTVGDPLATVKSDLNDQRVNRLHHTVADLAAQILVEGGTTNWQFSSVRTYLLRGAQDGRSFTDRVSALTRATSTPSDGQPPPALTWIADSQMSKGASYSWSGKAVPQSEASSDATVIKATTITDAGSRTFCLRTDAAADDSRSITQGMARLHFHGTVAVDLARLTVPMGDLRLRSTIDVARSEILSYLPVPEMPRMQAHRVKRAVANAYARFREDPADGPAMQTIAGLRWMSVALTRWRESPAMAGTLCYVALDAAFNGCVARHRRNCVGAARHESALELYLRTLRGSLAGEIEEYLLRIRGTAKEVRAGRRSPPKWMLASRSLRRDRRGVAGWSSELMTAMSGDEDSDPLLRFRLAELRKFNGARLRLIGERCEKDLTELRKARNELVHDSRLLLSEQRASYLAALATEMLLVRAETLR